MNKNKVRVRFAPSPTGIMHLGNIRVALMNFLFARKNNGTFIIRIEDTDPQRNFDPGAKQILSDLAWLNISYDEGPNIGGPYKPYFQSERTEIYKEFLEELKKRNLIYPCFCTQEELEKKRERQIALKMPPRYDRTCLKLKKEQVDELMAKKTPFIWRFKLDESLIEITDLSKGQVSYDLKNFSDFPLTRQDESVTFIFANFVDDLTMKISHVIRGEDHLSNTALQAALYKAFDAEIPIFYHMPILCNSEGKKLSKRDFGFSLNDLRSGGFLPEAICNYLLNMIIGSSENEIMDLDELIKAVDFENIPSTSHARYDVEKLRWINHKWINRIHISDLAKRVRPYLDDAFSVAKELEQSEIESLVSHIRPNLITLTDIVEILKFYFVRPVIHKESFEKFDKKLFEIIKTTLDNVKDNFSPDNFIKELEIEMKNHGAKPQELFKLIRYGLTGETTGLSVKDLLKILSKEEIYLRLGKI